MRFLDTEGKRFAAVVIAMALVMGLITGLTIFLLSQPSNGTKSVPVSEQERKELTLMGTDFVTRSATWGVVTEKLTGDNIQQVRYLWSRNIDAVDTLVRTKPAIYEDLRKDYIASEGKLSYPASAVSGWTDRTAQDSLLSMDVTSVKVTPASKADRMAYGGSQVRMVTLDVELDAKATMRMPTSTDASWKGDYAVSVRDYHEEFALTVVETASGWRVYDIVALRTPFLLAVTGNPSTLQYEKSLFDFKNVGTLTSNPKIKK